MRYPALEARLSSIEAKAVPADVSNIIIDWEYEFSRYHRLLPDLNAIREGKLRS